jgi:hypothetical protein
VPLPEAIRMHYAVAEQRAKFRISSENPDNLPIIGDLVRGFADEQILIIIARQAYERKARKAKQHSGPINNAHPRQDLNLRPPD